MPEAPKALGWNEALATVTAPGGPFAIGEAEIRGQKLKVFEDTPVSLRALFDRARAHGDAIALVYEQERWSFAQVLERIDQLAHAMVERYGIQPGDRVAIAMRNYPEWVVSFAAATSVGAIAVCLNAWWTSDELHYGLEDSGARLLVADAERIQRSAPSLQRLGLRALAVRTEGELPPGAERLEEVLVPGAPRPEVEILPHDDAMIVYTSGTTGKPKGAVSTHHAVLSALMAFGCAAAAQQLARPPSTSAPHPWPTSLILVVPLFHVTGLIPVMLNAFANGFKLVMMYKWNAERALELIERERVTHFVGVPTMTRDLLESPDFATRDTSSLQSVGGGGAPAPPELVQRIDRSFAKGRPGIGYGMTETNAYGPQNAGDDYVRKPRSVGRAVSVLEVKVADESGEELPRGEVGEILFRGPNLIRGYWNKPEATAETFIGGWLRSGDIGRMDEEGFVFVEDRAKEMVLRGGENVYCAEVEAAIHEHDAVYEAAVFGLPHERLGEEVAAAIYPKPGAELDPEQLSAHLRERLAPFKIPSTVELTDSPLPRNASGKIQKREIRDAILARRR